MSDTRIYINDITIQLDPSNPRLGYIVRRFVMDEPAHEEFLGEAGWSRDKYHLPTTELATALAMGHGAIPLSFAHERQLIETAEELLARADACIRLQVFPTIDRYISEGNRQAAVEFSKQIPGSVMKAVCMDRARFHNVGGFEPKTVTSNIDELSALAGKAIHVQRVAEHHLRVNDTGSWD
jgi:hypothetical protein